MIAEPVCIGVICGAKSTDALLCQSLEQAGFHIKIAQYKIPIRDWLPWLTRRVQERGVGTLVGNLLLAIWLRIERMIDHVCNHSPWLTTLAYIPSWQRVDSKPKRCSHEEDLREHLKNADVILLLDAFRLSPQFFRRLKQPCFQVIWGSVPSYLGDSGGYWAYTRQEPVAVSLIVRTGQFDSLKLAKEIRVFIDEVETARTIKVKQAVALSAVLAKSLSRFINEPPDFSYFRKTHSRIFYAPTLWTYLTTSSLGKDFPAYAMRKQPCRLYEKT